ncbi:hypothetical protein K1T71_010739 [Dendrolimus kikuchii]|uniref:Uncharacterized protein n=1 Tax=Dendrolimus kikuchii TaxID=765133 RepID=A0ACC1CQ06_9NEOP|nr:hypothetical protein K1T71_010739 [Dendrolimus kikuchii]
MEKEIESDIIKATQNSLGKYVKRPPLSEKLLKKPPFRFLHDIITTVLKTTSFFDGLFDENELISDNVKDRESKIVFLNKVISVLSLTTGKTLSVKSSKIVAGQEPEKTNELLQCLALALDKKLSSDEAVKKIKGISNSLQDAQTQKKISTKSTKKNVSNPLVSKSSEKLSSRKGTTEKSATKNEKDKITEIKIRKKENGQVKQPKVQPSKTNTLKDSVSLQSKSGTKVSLIEKSKTSSKNTENLNSHKKDLEPLVTEKFNEPLSHDKEVLEENEQVIPNQDIRNESPSELNNDRNETGKLNSSYTLADGDLNLSSSTNDIKELENNTTGINTDKNENVLKSDDISLENNQLQIKKNEIEQSNLDPDENHANDNQVPQIQQIDEPIKHLPLQLTNTTPITQNNTTITRPLSVRPSSSRPGAPRLREKLDNLVSETENVLLGKVHIITENTGHDEEEEGSLIIVEPQESESHSANDTQNDSYLLQNEHGHLVQQILDSQRELSEVSGKTEIEWQFGVQKAKEAQHQEIDQLKFNIQTLSRVANPLGKLLDHIQEDVEVMRQELQQWKNIYDDVSKEISKEKTLNEDSLQPLHAKLKQLEIEIEEKADKICDLKILIHKNATRIEKLLNSGNVQ